jgi:hypothetical protein
MNYWVDLYDAGTWKESREHGLSLTGFDENMRAVAERIRPGDILLCCVVRVQRWVGALEVIGRSTDMTTVWTKSSYPVRFAVRPIVALSVEQGVPQSQLDDRKNPFCPDSARHQLRGMVRASPTRFTHIDDAEAILAALKAVTQ